MTPLFNQLAVQKTIVNKLRNAGIEAEGVMYEEEGIGIVALGILPVNSKGISTTDMLSIGISLSSWLSMKTSTDSLRVPYIYMTRVRH